MVRRPPEGRISQGHLTRIVKRGWIIVETNVRSPGGNLQTFSLHMRTTWNGSISFGLVNILVGLAPATASSARQSDVQFRLLHRDCLTSIKQKRWCPVHDVEVGPDQLVKGWEVSKGEFVAIDDAEIEAIEEHDTSRAIGITRFIPLGEVDPMYYDRSYFLIPSGAEAQRRPYALLLRAMTDAGVAGLGSFVLAGKEKLCLIRAAGEALVLETLFVHDDVRSNAEIAEAVAASPVKDDELLLAQQIISGLSGNFDPTELRSGYRERLRSLLEAKLEGRAPEPQPAAPVATPAEDLMAVLRASVIAAKAAATTPATPKTKALSKTAASAAGKKPAAAPKRSAAGKKA